MFALRRVDHSSSETILPAGNQHPYYGQPHGLSSFNSGHETSLSQNAEENLGFLDVFFEQLIEHNPDQTSSTPNALLIRFYNQLKNNQFEAAIQTIKDNPHCLQQMHHLLPMTQLTQFFLFLLRKKLVLIIQPMWESNTLLASYFSGKPIQIQLPNAARIIETKTYELTLQELIANFTVALDSQYHPVIQAMWEGNTLLASYFSGKEVEVARFTDVEGPQATEKWQLNMLQLIANFKAALNCKNLIVIQSMWKKDTLLASYFSGKPIKIQGTDAGGRLQTQSHQLTTPELIANLKSALVIKHPALIRSIWDNNPLVAAYFSGQPIQVKRLNGQGIIQTQPYQITLQELVANFNAALASQYLDIIKCLWDNNPQLVAYFSGKPIQVNHPNAQGIIQPQTPKLTMPELIANFNAALAGHYPAVVKSLWDNNPQLADYFSGEAIQVNLLIAQGIMQPQTCKLTMPELFANFKAALAGEYPEVINAIWGRNRLFTFYFSGNPIPVQLVNPQGMIQTEIWQLTMPELIANFNAALASRYLVVIEGMWHTNPVVAAYFSGQPIQIKSPNAQGIIQTQTWQLPMPELLANFNTALAVHSVVVIQSMWNCNNSPLQVAIKTLDDSALTTLIENVLANIHHLKDEFTRVFLDSISNQLILETCLNKKNKKKPNNRITTQIGFLNARLASIASAAAISSSSNTVQQDALIVETEEAAPIAKNIALPFAVSWENDDELQAMINWENENELPATNDELPATINGEEIDDELEAILDWENDDELEELLESIHDDEHGITSSSSALPLIANSMFTQSTHDHAQKDRKRLRGEEMPPNGPSKLQKN